MEIRCGDVEAGDLVVGQHLCALLVEVMVQPTLDGEPGLRGRAGDQLDDDLMCQQRLAAPVLGDEREEPVLDAVPLCALPRRIDVVGANPTRQLSLQPEAPGADQEATHGKRGKSPGAAGRSGWADAAPDVMVEWLHELGAGDLHRAAQIIPDRNANLVAGLE